MDRTFVLDYGPPGRWVGRPRLWGLFIGLLMTAASGWALAWLSGASAAGASGVALDLRVALGALAVGGTAVMLQALFSERLYVQRVSFGADGVQIGWTHVPHLFGLRLGHDRLVAWHDVSQVQWQEGSLEHDLKQHLVLVLTSPLGHGRHRLKLLVCDHRDAQCCESLLAHLPGGTQTPSWLASSRSSQPARLVP